MPSPVTVLRQIIAWVLASLSLAAHAADTAVPAIEFSAQEKAYIKHSAAIRMCVDPDWEPFEHINQQGEHEGIAADLVRLVAERVGLKIELHQVLTWDESLKAAKEGKCQILSFLNQTPERDEWLNFTAPIFVDPNIVITREEHAYIGDLKGVSNKTVALPRGTMIEERIRREYPNLTPILTDNERQAVSLVSERKADMTIRSLTVAAYAIKREGLFNLKIAGHVPDFTNKLRIGVVKDQTVLRNILDKGVKTLTAQEREAISSKHVTINVQQGFDYSLFWKIIAGAVFVLAVAIYWDLKLRKLNKELARLTVTDKLTGVFNRMKLDESLATETLRAQRTGQPFSVILIDVDLFKQVNDSHGHQVGDQVLIEVAQLLRNGAREIDIVGRWGGEEFLVCCPHTDSAGAFRLAEKLRQNMQDHRFPVVESKTASFGVSTFKPGDTGKDIIARADSALYLSKNSGRNQVRVWSSDDE